jgi:hypothetical protein
MSNPIPDAASEIARRSRIAAALAVVSLAIALGLWLSGESVAWTTWALPVVLLWHLGTIRFLAMHTRLSIASSIASGLLALAILASVMMSIVRRF